MDTLPEVIIPPAYFEGMTHKESLIRLVIHFNNLWSDDNQGWHYGMSAIEVLTGEGAGALANVFEVPHSTFIRWQVNSAPHPRLREIYLQAAIDHLEFLIEELG